MEYLSVIPTLQHMAAGTKIPTLKSLFASLMHGKLPTLRRNVWDAIYVPSRASRDALEPFMEAVYELQQWIHVLVDKDINNLETLLSGPKSTERIKLQRVLQSFISCTLAVRKQLRPGVAEVESFLEMRVLPHLDGWPSNSVMKCAATVWPWMHGAARDRFLRLTYAKRGRPPPERFEDPPADDEDEEDDEEEDGGGGGADGSAAAATESAESGGSDSRKEEESKAAAVEGKADEGAGEDTRDEAGSAEKAGSEEGDGDEDSGSGSKDDSDDAAASPSKSAAAEEEGGEAKEGDETESSPTSASTAPKRPTTGRARIGSLSSAGRLLHLVASKREAVDRRRRRTVAKLKRRGDRLRRQQGGADDDDSGSDDEESDWSSPELRRLREWVETHEEDVQAFVEARCASILSLEDVVELYFINLMAAVTTMICAELLGSDEVMKAHLADAMELASDFARTVLPMLQRLLVFQPSLLERNVLTKSCRGLSRASYNSDFRRTVRKIAVLDGVFSSLDVHLFPMTFEAHGKGVKSISASHTDKDVIVTGGYDRLVRIYNIRTGVCLGQFCGHRSIVSWVAFSADDLLVASASFDATLRVWNCKTAKCMVSFVGHRDSVLDADWSPDNALLLSASMDSTVRLWDAHTGACYRVFHAHEPDSWVKAVCFTPDGMGFVSCGLDRQVVVWSLAADAVRPTRFWDGHDDYILDAAVTQPKVLLTTSKDGTLKLWNLDSGTLGRVVDPGFSSWASTVAFSPDGKLFVCATFDNYILILNSASGRVLRQLRVHNEGTLVVRFSAGCTEVICGTSSGRIQILPL
eukprot:PLAT11363.1.p1 GENE.PLAT11363.1~~PLAT11363.1.p1  ORF type:complete len:809 (-),score=285.88 PLAT11363.1:1359-3785(-)